MIRTNEARFAAVVACSADPKTALFADSSATTSAMCSGTSASRVGSIRLTASVKLADPKKSDHPYCTAIFAVSNADLADSLADLRRMISIPLQTAPHSVKTRLHGSEQHRRTHPSRRVVAGLGGFKFDTVVLYRLDDCRL
jgi:hypothetical protein